MSTPVEGSLERVLKHDRIIVLSALVVIMSLAWLYTLAGVGMSMNAFEMTAMPSLLNSTSMRPLHSVNWDLWRFIIMLGMWWLMMIAMMLPSATPVILLAAALNRRANSDLPPYGQTGYFTLGYLIAWLVFSLVAVLIQWTLEHHGIMNAMMQNASRELAAGLLITAGIWQFSSLKQACLKHCRSPVDFLIRYKRPGDLGAFLMGLQHGTYCLGCCWCLMGLLFAACIMDLYWIIGLTLFVLIEKLFAKGRLFGQIAGVFLIFSGILLLINA